MGNMYDNDDDGSASPLDGFGSLLRLSGRSVPARARFVGESFFSGIYSAAIFGLVAGQVGVLCTPVGPILPFLAGSTVGFGVGIWSHWTTLMEKTKQYARFYPTILAHAVWTEQRIVVPASILQAQQRQAAHYRQGGGGSDIHGAGGVTGGGGVLPYQDANHRNSNNNPAPLVEWITPQGIRHLSMCAIAAQTCQADVRQVDKQQREQINEAFLEATTPTLAAAAAAAFKGVEDDDDTDL